MPTNHGGAYQFAVFAVFLATSCTADDGANRSHASERPLILQLTQGRAPGDLTAFEIIDGAEHFSTTNENDAALELTARARARGFQGLLAIHAGNLPIKVVDLSAMAPSDAQPSRIESQAQAALFNRRPPGRAEPHGLVEPYGAVEQRDLAEPQRRRSWGPHLFAWLFPLLFVVPLACTALCAIADDLNTMRGLALRTQGMSVPAALRTYGLKIAGETARSGLSLSEAEAALASDVASGATLTMPYFDDTYALQNISQDVPSEGALSRALQGDTFTSHCQRYSFRAPPPCQVKSTLRTVDVWWEPPQSAQGS